MTNRYGRAIDRARTVADLLRNEGESDPRGRQTQLHILARRARLLRLSITLATLTLLLTALLIITLFLTSLFKMEVAAVVVGLFIVSMLSLIASLIVFLMDLNVSLGALDLEIKMDLKKP